MNTAKYFIKMFLKKLVAKLLHKIETKNTINMRTSQFIINKRRVNMHQVLGIYPKILVFINQRTHTLVSEKKQLQQQL